MLRTLMVGLFPRAASIALGFLFCFCLAATAGEMTSSLLIGNARIDIVIEPTSPYPPAKDIFRWVKSASESVTNYYGRFPVPRVLIRITPFEGRGVRNGMAFGDRDGRITIRVGNPDISLGACLRLDADPRNGSPGFSLRGRKSPLDQKKGLLPMGFDLVRDMPQGLPQIGDRGVDRTHTWGRTYWGGALFCLLADVETRRQTNNAKGLEHALRGILDAGGDIRKEWNLQDVLAVGDRAVGVSVLQTFYARMKDKPVGVDLDSLWTQLGIQSEGSSVRFDERLQRRNPARWRIILRCPGLPQYLQGVPWGPLIGWRSKLATRSSKPS